MNIEHAAPLNSLKRLKSRTDRKYQGAAFTSTWSDGSGDRAAVRAALDHLDALQAQCLDRPILDSELSEAFEILGGRCEKANWHLARFQKGLILADQAQRFEATTAALRMVRRALGQ